MPSPKHLRVFLSSPADVSEERQLALQLLKARLPSRPFIRGRVVFDPISWDDPDAKIPFEAQFPPQEAINRGLARPSECDVVIVMLWRRMGTPLSSEYKKEDGSSYLSGTEWEYEEALKASKAFGRPRIIVYVREDKRGIQLANDEQQELVNAFVARFRNADGSYNGSVNTYATPGEFRDLLEEHIEHLLDHELDSLGIAGQTFSNRSLRSRISRFEAEYLEGQNGAPMPFGGREAQFAHLDAWLTDERADSRLLISAPAGRGKSALLAQWMKSLKDRKCVAPSGAWHLAFVPISIRFETNAPEVHYQLLAQQLARIACETLQAPATDPAGYYADYSRDLLQTLTDRGTRTLVVLDALDEAIGSSTFSTLFPRNPAPTLRILASARWQVGDHNGDGWLDRLDWPKHRLADKHFDLPKLRPDEIADMLIRMGAPVDVIGRDKALVERLAILTEGEPLLLRFYAEDLWHKTTRGAAVSRNDLDSLKPGLGSYFQRWLELQEQHWKVTGESFDCEAIDTALAVLSFAKGPLESHDLLNLVRVTSLNVKCPRLASRLLAPLRRFVIGDGSRQEPYVLSHPKLGDYLRDERFAEIAEDMRNGFAVWGRNYVTKLNRGELKPEQASSYALHFIARHFEDAQASSEDFMSLVENGWRCAWEHFEGGQRGFSADIQKAWNALPRDNSYLGFEWRCALALSSIKSLGHSMPSELVVAAVQKGVLSPKQGQHFAELMASHESSVKTYASLALLSANENICVELAGAAIERACAPPNQATCAAFLGDLLYLLLKSEKVLTERIARFVLEQVAREVEALTEPFARTWGFGVLALHLPEPQRTAALAEARTSAKAIANDDLRAWALVFVAPHLPEPERTAALAKALTAARTIYDERTFARLLGPVAQHLPAELLVEVLAAARKIYDGDRAAWAIAMLAPHLPADLFAEVLAEAEAITDEDERAWRLGILARHLPEPQRVAAFADALAGVNAIADKVIRAFVLGSLARHLPELQRIAVLAEALAVARTIAEDDYRAKALGSLAPNLPEPQRTAVLAEALTAANADGASRAAALTELALHLPVELLAEALTTSKAIADDDARVCVLGSLALCLPEPQRATLLAEALAVARTIVGNDARAWALGNLGPNLPESQGAAALAEALTAARTIADDVARARALASVAPHLPAELLADALAATAGLENPYGRGTALGSLAPHLPTELLADALAAAIAIENAPCRALALGGLAWYLPEPQRAAAVAEGLSAAYAKKYGDRADELGSLAPHLPEPQRAAVLAEALIAAQTIPNEDTRARTLGRLAVHLPEPQRPAVLAEALTAARAMADNAGRAVALGSLALNLLEPQRAAVLAEALIAAQTIPNDDARARALESLFPHLPAELLAEALTAAKAIADDDARAWTLGRLAPYLPTHLQNELSAELLRSVPLIKRGSALFCLADALVPTQSLGGMRAMCEILRAIKDVSGWYP